METIIDKEYWSNRYASGDVAWDIGEISTPLKKYIDGLTDRSSSILIPGCGNAYEAEYLIQKGFTNITLVDFSPVLVESLLAKLKQHVGSGLTIICGDFFEVSSRFDLILEQTFLSALPPSLRKTYAAKMHELLNANGIVAGVLFDKMFQGGPPFGGSKDEYELLFADKFTIEIMKPCYNSIAPRMGSELFIRLRKA